MRPNSIAVSPMVQSFSRLSRATISVPAMLACGHARRPLAYNSPIRQIAATRTGEERVVGVLDGQVALVTGASQGIGLATAVALSEAGATVAFNYRQQPHRRRPPSTRFKRPAAEPCCWPATWPTNRPSSGWWPKRSVLSAGWTLQ